MTLGTTPLESLGNDRYQLSLADFPALVAGTTVGAESTQGFDLEAVTSNWFGGCVMEPGPDENSCNQLASLCGYQDCNAANAIGGAFGGCAGLMCHCKLNNGSWVEDSIGMAELNTGFPECDRSTEVSVPNPAPPATQTSEG
jgi:hypothetical protein